VDVEQVGYLQGNVRMSKNMSISEEKFKQATTYLLPFEKLQGLGNDFVIINHSHLPDNSSIEYEQSLTKKICNRYLGIGADGLIVIAPVKESSDAIRSWRYYNSDGSIGEMCGNGIRCAAKYIYEHGLSHEETKFKIETLAGDIGIEMLDDDLVKVDMGPPREILKEQSLNIENFKFDYTFVSMGNPHAVGFFDNIELVKDHGPKIEIHSNFPKKTNVEFAKVIDSNTIELIVWERGCGFTQACGTGACATAIAGILLGKFNKDNDITVKLPGGNLIIHWDSVAETIFMTGKAEMSFLGYYNA
jgi:diaminopimelate epimerase